MDRYSNLDLVLECEEGKNVSKTSLFGGIFKKPSKNTEPSVKIQESMAANDDIAKSNDILTESSKNKGGIIKGIFKKTNKAEKEEEQQYNISTQNSELTGSSDSLAENKAAKSGVFGGLLKRLPRPGHNLLEFSATDENQSDSGSNTKNDSTSDGETSGSKDDLFHCMDDLSTSSKLSGSSCNLSENPAKEKGKLFGWFKKKSAKSQLQEKSSNPDEMLNEEIQVESQPSHKQIKLVGAVAKHITFQTAKRRENQNGSSEEAHGATSEKSQSTKQSTVFGAISEQNPIHSANKKDINKTGTAMDEQEREENPKVKRNLIQQDREETSEPPPVPLKPAKEDMKEMSVTVKQGSPMEKSHSGEQDTKDDESVASKGSEDKHLESKTCASDEKKLNKEESSSREEKTEDVGKDKTEKTKIKKPKKHNPFMPRVKAKVIQKNANTAEGDAMQNECDNRTLFDQLEDFRMKFSLLEARQNVEDLMKWWNSVEPWEDAQQDEDMTEKEEAKAFAVTAEKVQKGIRVFNKLFSERAESLWQHVIDLNSIADGLDKFNKNTKIAQITGGSTSAIGGVATIAGLALAPVTMGTSLIVTAVGLGVATAGGLTSAGAGISNQVNNSMDRKKVEKIVEDYQEKITDLNKCLKFIKQGIENLRKFDLIKMKKNTYNQDFPALTSSFYEDGAMAGKAILINANEIMRVVQIANVAGSTAARAVQIASMATGVLTGLFVGMDIYFVAKDSKELKKGAKSEFAAKIRTVAMQLHDGLVELNSIREELQSTAPDNANSKNITLNKTKEKEEKSE